MSSADFKKPQFAAAHDTSSECIAWPPAGGDLTLSYLPALATKDGAEKGLHAMMHSRQIKTLTTRILL